MCSPGSAWTRRICSLVRRHSGTGSDAKCTRGVRADLVVSAAFASSFDALCAVGLRADDVDRSSEPLDEADFDAGLSAGLSSVGHTFGLGASDGVIAESHGVEGDEVCPMSFADRGVSDRSSMRLAERVTANPCACSFVIKCGCSLIIQSKTASRANRRSLCLSQSCKLSVGAESSSFSSFPRSQPLPRSQRFRGGGGRDWR